MMNVVDLKPLKFPPFYCSSSFVLILHFFAFLQWLHIFYTTVTNVSHHQPHRPTFKTTASTVSYHFHLLAHHVCVCVWQKIERCGGALYSTQLPRGSRNLDSIITQERSLQARHQLALLNVVERGEVASSAYLSLCG